MYTCEDNMKSYKYIIMYHIIYALIYCQTQNNKDRLEMYFLVQ